jgi:hypothetical protein
MAPSLFIQGTAVVLTTIGLLAYVPLPYSVFKDPQIVERSAGTPYDRG